MVTGYQRQHRKSVSYLPSEGADPNTTDQYTRLITHVCNTEGIHEQFSKACELAAISGMVLMQPYLDYSTDPAQGTMRLKIWEYNSFLLDPYFRNPDTVSYTHLIHRQTLAEVSGRSKKLKDALKMISKSQEGRIFQGGMKGIYKENTVGRALTCKYKWQPPPQKSQVTVKNSNIKSMMDFADGESADMMKPD